MNRIKETLSNSNILNEEQTKVCSLIFSKKPNSLVDKKICDEIIEIIQKNKEIIDNTRVKIIEELIKDLKENNLEIQAIANKKEIQEKFTKKIMEIITSYNWKVSFESNSYNFENVDFVYDIDEQKKILRYRNSKICEMILVQKNWNIWEQTDSIKYEDEDLVTLIKENNILQICLWRNTSNYEFFHVESWKLIKNDTKE